MIEQAWLIPALPFLAFFAIVFFGKKLAGGHIIGIASISASFFVSLTIFIKVIQGTRPFEQSMIWAPLGPSGFHMELGMRVDGLAAMMFVVVCFVSLMVQIYSTAYMRGDRRYTWYFAALSLFSGSMLLLVIANNLIQLLVGWELVGICSYLLIGHWFEEKENSNAAMKAFITTKIGDVPFYFGIFVLFTAANTFNIGRIEHLAETGAISAGVLTLAAVLLFGGAIGKSAQFPLHVWLPDAMAGPTPVSALIHAATMVTAGVYLVARLFEVFNASGTALNEVAIIGAITMVIAAVLALVQDDIKRVLAYSTISQLAYMMAALGVGAPVAAVFHLWTHAFFKALLFLGAGSVIHAMHTNSMRAMGGLKKSMPTTYWTFLVGSLALAGIFPLAGFWSKDEILTGALDRVADGGVIPLVVAVCAFGTAFLTAVYMGRAVALTFHGTSRYGEANTHPHESPPAMTSPLVLLALMSIAAGWVGIPGIGGFGDWIALGEPHEATFNMAIAAASTLLAVAGLALGLRVGASARASSPVAESAWSRFLQNGYYLDAVYWRLFVRPVRDKLSAFAYGVLDRRIIDAFVNGVASATAGLGIATYKGLDQVVIDGVVNGAAAGAGASGSMLRRLQNGNVQTYGVALFLGVLVLVTAFIIF